jgi:hypothetical protein
VVKADVLKFLAVGPDNMLDDAHSLAVRQKFPSPPVNDFAATLEAALDLISVEASENEEGVATGQRLLTAIECASVSKFHLVSVGIVAVETETQALRNGLDGVDGAAARPPELIV